MSQQSSYARARRLQRVEAPAISHFLFRFFCLQLFVITPFVFRFQTKAKKHLEHFASTKTTLELAENAQNKMSTRRATLNSLPPQIRASSLISIERARPAFGALAARRINPLIYLLLMWLSTCVWLGFFTFSVGMPLLVQRVREGWELPSQVTATMQASSSSREFFS